MGSVFPVNLVGDARFELATSSVSRKRATTAPTARGGDGIRTRVHGFAVRCLASRPLHRVEYCLRADDEIRTRDPHLGKVMRYQLRYIRTVRDTGIEPVTSSVSGKRSPAELNAQYFFTRGGNGN